MIHGRAFQHLQKSQLKLIRLHAVNLFKGTPEAFIILTGKSGDQIQMLMDISKALYTGHRCFQLFQIHVPVDRTDGIRIVD